MGAWGVRGPEGTTWGRGHGLSGNGAGLSWIPVRAEQCLGGHSRGPPGGAGGGEQTQAPHRHPTSRLERFHPVIR